MTKAKIDIAICTFRRPSLAQTLQSIAQQSDLDQCRIIIADNDVTPSAEHLVHHFRKDIQVPILYIHAPAKNISVARNACLATSESDYLAFIDDDLIASPQWLEQLVAKIETTGADAVFGPVIAHYPNDTHSWLQKADLHSINPVKMNGQIQTGYTCNVLMRSTLTKSFKFDVTLGVSGGEDTLFFHQAFRSGAKFAEAPLAIVHEQVDPARLNLRWLLQRSFRSGQSHARILQDRARQKTTALLPAFAKVIYCLIASGLTLPFAHQWRKNLVRGALHLGTLSKLIHLPDLKIYR